MNNVWDDVGMLISGKDSVSHIPTLSADNRELAWPAVLEIIRSAFGSTGGQRILDYGCGAGDFCQHLQSLGNAVAGCDSSIKMLGIATQRVPPSVILLGSEVLLTSKPRLDVITAIMVFPFIPTLEKILPQLLAMIDPGGVVVIASFNPPFIVNLAAVGMTFHSLDDPRRPTKAVMDISPGVQIPVFIRSAEQYAAFFSNYGWKEISRSRPPFHPAFLQQHPVPYPVQDPEFLIQGFVKG
jgi:2-polyprenyl-3-methyl-5-hydroxy-6-metoxy-1,4-benzoquinol methylase